MVTRMNDKGENPQHNLHQNSIDIDSIFRAAPVGIGMMINRIFIEANSVMCKMLGYSRKELIGQSARKLYQTEEEYQRVGKIKYEAIDKFGIGSIESQFLTKEGQIIDVYLSSVPLDPNDYSRGITFTVMDITERKNAERNIEFRLQFERLLTEISSQFINLPTEKLDKAVHDALREISKFTEVDRSYVFLFSDDLSLFNCTGLWMQENDPYSDYYNHPKSTEKIQWWLNTLKKGKVFRYTTLESIPASEEFMLSMIRDAGIKSQIDVPVFCHNKLIGFLGMVTVNQEKEWPGEHISLLKIFAEIIANVLDRKQMEDDLRQTEINLRCTLESTADGITVVDNDNNILLSSKRVLKILGIEQTKGLTLEQDKITQAVYKNFEEPEDYLKKSAEICLTTENHQGRFRLINGSIIEYYTRPLLIDGIKKGRVWSYRNITEQEKAKQAVEEITKQLRAMYEAASNIAFIITDFSDPIPNILEFSPGAENIWQYKKEEIIGKPVSILYTPDMLPEIKKRMKSFIGKNKDFTAFHTCSRKDGEVFPALVSLYPVMNDRGEVYRIVGVGFDISEQLSTEKALQESQTLSQNLIDSSPLGMLFYELNEDGDLILVGANKAADGITGINTSLQIGKTIEQAFPNLAGTEIPEQYKKTALYGEKWSKTDQFYEDDQIKGAFDIQAFQLAPRHLAVMFQDVTERKQYEVKLKAAKEKAEESDRLKSAFLANMSHEIRTPMNAILGFSELLQSDELSPDDINQYIHLINSKGKELMAIITDLIDISRMEAGDLSLYITPIDINSFLMKIISGFREEKSVISKARLSIRHNFPESESPVCHSDKLRLTQVLNNLLANALKFTSDGYIELGYELAASRINFYIKDTGIGIPANKQSVIFERFRQADDSFTRHYGGAGLGLSISSQIIEILGGKMWVESVEKQGSIFYFSLPLRNEAVKEKDTVSISRKKIPETEAVFDNKKILIAEDDSSNYLFFESMLQKSNAELLWARNGQQAIDILKEHGDTDLIIMDIRMPELDGLQATRAIRKTNRDIPIIALTAFAFAHDRENSLAAGCNEYISKPVKPGQLKNLLQKYLS